MFISQWIIIALLAFAKHYSHGSSLTATSHSIAVENPARMKNNRNFEDLTLTIVNRFESDDVLIEKKEYRSQRGFQSRLTRSFLTMSDGLRQVVANALNPIKSTKFAFPPQNNPRPNGHLRRKSYSRSISKRIRSAVSKLSLFAMSPMGWRIIMGLCSMAYALNYSTTKHLQETLKPSTIMILRFFLGSLYFLPYFLAKPMKLGVLFGSIEIGIYSAIGFIAQASLLESTAAGKVSLFSSLSVVIAPILDSFFAEKERSMTAVSHSDSFSLRKCVSNFAFSSFSSPVIALLGAVALEWGGMERLVLSDSLLLITPISFALSFWRSESLCSKYSEDSYTISGIMLLTTGALSFAWAIANGDLSPFAPSFKKDVMGIARTILSDRNLIRGVLETAFLATTWTCLMEQLALHVIKASDITLIYSLEPLFASAFAFAMLGEKVTSNMIVGSVFILAACVWDTFRVSLLEPAPTNNALKGTNETPTRYVCQMSTDSTDLAMAEFSIDEANKLTIVNA